MYRIWIVMVVLLGGAGAFAADDPLVVHENGNVGINVATPGTRLTLNGGDFIGWRWSTTNSSIYHQIGHANGGDPEGYPLQFHSTGNDHIYDPAFQFYTDMPTTSVKVTIRADGNLGVGTVDPQRTLHVQGTSYIATNLGIGTFNPSQMLHVAGSACINSALGVGTLTPVQTLHVDGMAYVTSRIGINVANPQYALHVDGTAWCTDGVWTTSDYRLKQNIVPLSGALDRVMNLKPQKYCFKNTPDRVDEGFIAHELQAVIPAAVMGEKDAVDAKGEIASQGVNYSTVIPTLTGAIQELKRENDAVKAENTKLAAAVAALLKRVEALEAVKAPVP